MNVGLLILIVLIILIFLTILGLLLYNNNVVTVLGTSSGTLNVSHCVPSITSLPDLTFNNCCINFGTLTNNKYLSQLNLTVSPNVTPFLQSCSSFCTQGYNPETKICDGNIDSDNTQFNNCIKAADPAGRCADISFPVAQSNGRYLYAFSARTTLCTSQTQCALVL